MDMVVNCASLLRVVAVAFAVLAMNGVVVAVENDDCLNGADDNFA